jgi:GAF domain-containing protein
MSQHSKSDPLADAGRLQALDEALVATEHLAEQFDGLAKLAAEALNVPIVVITLISTSEQKFIGEFGLAGPMAESRMTPIADAICQYTVRLPTPFLSIEDLHLHPLIDHYAAVEMNIRAYLGIQLPHPDGSIVGTICFVDFRPRNWADEGLFEAFDVVGKVINQLEDAIVDYQSAKSGNGSIAID